jgi:hypothetical protein
MKHQTETVAGRAERRKGEVNMRQGDTTMSQERWHIADEDGNPTCGAKDAAWETLVDIENIADADRRGILCADCAGDEDGAK